MSVTLKNVDDVYPLTATQQGMLYHTLADPSSGVYVNQVITPISGELDVPRFERAWERVLARHETLRTAFVWDGLDDPLQVVRSEARTEWHHLDLSGVSDPERERKLAGFLGDDRRRGFDLSDPPLCRMMLVRLGPSEWQWIWSFHHLIADGWSANLIMDELFATYGATEPPRIGPTSQAQYRDFVAFHLSRDEAAEEAFWRARLAGFTEPHRLAVPGFPPHPEASGHETYSFDLGAATSEAVAAMARDLNVTLNTVFLGAWALVLSRWTRSTDVVFGTTVAGRPASLPGVDHATGLFINTLPLRIQIAPSEQLGPWLREVQRTQIETRNHEQTSLAAIQRWSEVDGGQSLFDSILVFENYPLREHENRFAEIEIGERTYIEQSNYPLAVLAIPGESIRLLLVGDNSVFPESAIESLANQLMTLLGEFAAAPANRLADFAIVSDEDRDRLRTFATGPAVVEDDRCMHEIIESISARQPADPAVMFEGRSLSYRELDRAATQLAGLLQAAGVVPNRPVGLYLPRSTELIIGLLAILKAGGGYVPLDPAYPAGHIRQLLENDAIDIVLTNEDLRPEVPAPVAVVSTANIDGGPGGWEPSDVAPTDLAYVIHTSGSTGRPKGVMVSHRNLVQSTLARNVHYGHPVGRFLLLSSFAFDSSVAGIFWTLATGGTLVLPAPDAEKDIDQLLTLAADSEITHLLCLPALYQLLAEHAEGRLRTLQVAIVAGEACPSTVLESHLEHARNTALNNEYGPTEATVWCTVYRAESSDVGGPLPIGRPIAGTRVYLLDENGRQVPPGFAGELCVAGAGVTEGYLGRPDLTAERFVTVDIDGKTERIYLTGDLACYDSDGALLFLGRTDKQLKIRGHRIEPGAVEAALISHPTVDGAVVSGWSADGAAPTQLVGYVVFDGEPVDATAMRRYLRQRLPAFMVPDIYVPLARIPRLPNGKVDFSALPIPVGSPGRGSERFATPQSETEVALARIWSEILRTESAAIGADSDFFDLGGHSLLAIRLMSAIHTEFGTSLPLAALLDAPRLAEFAALIEHGRRPPESSLLVPIRKSGRTTLYLIHPGGGNVLVYDPLARHMSDQVAVIGVQARGVDGKEEPDRSFDQMAARYADEIRAHAARGRPVHLAGYSTGGLIAFEVARILEQDGYQVGLLALLDTVYPIAPGLPGRLKRELEIIRTGRWPGVRTVADFWWGSLRGLAGRARHGPRWKYMLSRRQPLPPDLAGKRINQIALSAARRYQPKPYPGTVVYIRAQGDGSRFNDSLPRWQAVSGKVIVRDTPGQHAGEGNMVMDPHAALVASIIEEELGRQ